MRTRTASRSCVLDLCISGHGIEMRLREYDTEARATVSKQAFTSSWFSCIHVWGACCRSNRAVGHIRPSSTMLQPSPMARQTARGGLNYMRSSRDAPMALSRARPLDLRFAWVRVPRHLYPLYGASVVIRLRTQVATAKYLYIAPHDHEGILETAVGAQDKRISTWLSD